MKRSAAFLGAVLLLWVVLSTYWYTCKIKGNCLGSGSGSTVSEQLIIELDGEPSKAFRIQNAGNGILSIVPQDGETGLSTIRKYMNEHPDRSIDLIAGSEEGANGLLAMFIISGIEKDRINVFVDETLIEKGRPIKLISTADQATSNTEPVDLSEEDADSNVWKDPLEDIVITTISEEPVDQKADQAVKTQPTRPAYTIEPALPCPGVQAGNLPSIGMIYYATGAYRVTCSAQLIQFAKLVTEAMRENENLKLEIIGHSDASTGDNDNYQLGLKRAIEVKKFLIRGDVPGHRILTFSQADNQPIANNQNAAGRSQNRRVEVRWK